MKHPDSGQLRAWADGALPAPEQAWVEAHLETCVRCQRQAAEVRARAEHVAGWMARQAPVPARAVPSSLVARRRLNALIAQKENAMRNRIFARRYRGAWIAAALVLVFAASFTLQPVRAVARDLLGLFRVQKIHIVEVDPDSVPDEDTLEAALSRLETVMEDRITIEGGGEPVPLDPDATDEQAGFPVRLPGAMNQAPRLMMKPYTYVEMQIDLQQVRALLEELGYDGQTLPDSLDGATMSMGLGPLVMAAYGSCQEPESDGSCTVLLQMPAPEVDAPAELDLNQLGRAYLQLLGLSADDAADLSSRIDWATTLVVPMPRSSNLSHSDVTVDGVTGILIRAPRSGRNAAPYMLTWIRDGVVYALRGEGTDAKALSIANSLP